MQRERNMEIILQGTVQSRRDAKRKKMEKNKK